MTNTALTKIDKQIEELETLHRLQVENVRFYYWNRNDDVQGDYWQDQANKTKKEIQQLKNEKAVLQKWS